MRRTTSGKPDESRPLLWLLDEMAHIGRMQAIEDAVTLYRGYGIRLWFIFQSLEQLKICFGDKAGTVLDNIGTQQYYGITSYETAEQLSKRIGDETRVVLSTGDSDSTSHPTGTSAQPQSGSRSRSFNVNRSEICRRLLKPEELLTIDKNVCLIFHKNLPVVLGRLVKFYEAKEFRWSGTAAPRRLGLAATFMAMVTLAASTVCAGLLVAMATARYQPGQVRSMGQRPLSAAARSQAGVHARQAPVRRPAQRKAFRPRRRPDRSELIKIQ